MGKKEISFEQKQLLIRYLIHVVPDVHQPFHVGEPENLGANLCDVKLKETDAKPMSLHHFWDDVVVELVQNTEGNLAEFIAHTNSSGEDGTLSSGQGKNHGGSTKDLV
jgi:hypothetical protein